MKLPSIGAAAIMLATIFAVGTPGEAGAQSPGFSFPVSYGSPAPPSSVGAQGSQGASGAIGPNIAGSATGAFGHIGPTTKTYPYEFAKVAATLHLRVFNGTLHPNAATPANHARVTLENVTSGLTLSASTNTAGFANITTFVGRYVLNVNTTGGRVNSTEELWVSSSLSISRYLIASSFATANVGNGGTPTTLFVQDGAGYLSLGAPEVRVDLHNGSINGPLLTTAWTGSNGTAKFTNVNKGLMYTALLIGWNSTLTDVRYFAANETFGQFNFTSSGTFGQYTPGANKNSFIVGTWGYNSATATIVGTGIPKGSQTPQQWVINQSTSVTGGQITISDELEAGVRNAYTVMFVNTVVYWNWTGAGVLAVALNLRFENSTLVMLNQNSYLASVNAIWFNDSVMIGSAIASNRLVQGACGYSFTFNLSLSSGFEHLSPPCSYQTSIGQSFQGRFVNSVFTNDTFVQFGIVKGVPTHILASSFVGTTLPRFAGTQSNISFDKVRFVNSSILHSTWTQTWMNQSSLVNTTWWEDQGAPNTTASIGNHNGASYVNNTWLNFSYNGSMKVVGMDNAYGVFHNDYFGYQVQGGKSVAQAIAGFKLLPQCGFNNPCLVPGEHWRGLIVVLPAAANFTSSYFNLTEFPSTNVTYYLLGGTGPTLVYHCVFNANYTQAQLTTLASSLSAPAIGMVSLRDTNNFVSNESLNVTVTHNTPANGGWYANYSTFNLATLATFGFADVVWFTHDTFPVYQDLNWWTWFQPFQNLPSIQTSIHIANNTFIRYNVAPAIGVTLSKYSSVATNYPICCMPAQDMDLANGYGEIYVNPCFWYACTGNIYFGHNTLYSRPNGILLADWPLFDMPFVNNGLDHNLFLNDPAYSTVLWGAPYNCDVGWRGQWFNSTSNWFYHLNNATLPYCEETYTVNQFNNQNTRSTFNNDHYYYAPYPGTTTLSPDGPWLGRETAAGGAGEPFTGFSIPAHSVLNYSVTMPPNGTVVRPNLEQLEFNTSLPALTMPIYGTKEYVWGIAPDVNQSSGTPEVSYANGQDGGPQPNFTFSGHKYVSNVEPDYVNISADSSSAAPINVGLVSPPGLAQVFVYNATSGAQISMSYVTVPSGGVYDARFTPSNESSGVIIYLIPFNSPFYHGNLDGLIMLCFGVTIVASIIVYVTHKRKQQGQWWG